MPGTTKVTQIWIAAQAGLADQLVAKCGACGRNAPAQRLKDGAECISGSCTAARRPASPFEAVALIDVADDGTATPVLNSLMNDLFR